jgi:hypothetical protein
MLCFIARFYQRYVLANPSKPLPADFFMGRGSPLERAEYQELLRQAVELGKKAEVIARIPGREMQRSPHNTVYFWDK